MFKAYEAVVCFACARARRRSECCPPASGSFHLAYRPPRLPVSSQMVQFPFMVLSGISLYIYLLINLCSYIYTFKCSTHRCCIFLARLSIGGYSSWFLILALVSNSVIRVIEWPA